jgi:hypothetical protein
LMRLYQEQRPRQLRKSLHKQVQWLSNL